MKWLLLFLPYIFAFHCGVHQYKFAYPYNNITNSYEVHGLWPEICCNLDYPEFCTNVTFNLKNITSILSQLEKIWYPTQNQTDQIDLMKHDMITLRH